MGAVDPRVQELAQAPNFAALTVHLPSGDAMTHVMWVDADDDHVLINTEVHRAKFKAVERDPRVTVMVWEKENPYRIRRCAAASSRRCAGPRPGRTSTRCRASTPGRTTPRRIQSERVILKIAPDVQHSR